MNIEQVLPKLTGVKKVGDGYLAFCPSHDDRSNRSLAIREDDGKLLMHCFVGCSFGSIIKEIGIEPDYTKPVEEAIYDYTDETGQVLYQVVRYFPKGFKQRHIKNGEYVWNLNGIKRVLFNLPQVIEAVEDGKMIFFVEGEKDCINLNHYGIIATTCSGGASSNWQPQYSEVLKGATVTIIPDNDNPGKEYAERIGNALYGWAKSLKILHLGSKDITEWLKTHNTDELQTLWDNTNEYIPLGSVTRDEFTDHCHLHNYISNRDLLIIW